MLGRKKRKTTITSFLDEMGWGSPKAQEKKRRESRSKVYFIQQGIGGPIKIGVSSNPERRVVNLQVANPTPLKIIATVPGTEKDELFFQMKFERFKIQGEWYLPDPELLMFIEELNK